jgi:hypothetical protein
MPGIVEALQKLLTPKSDVERFEGWPEAQQAIATAQILDPRAEGVSFVPQSPVSRLMNLARAKAMGMGAGSTIGEHSAKVPGTNRIMLDKDAYDRAQSEGENLSVSGLLNHELEHAKQRKDAGYLKHLINVLSEGRYDYGSGPLESEAFKAENMAPVKRRFRDIELPSGR